MTVATILHWPNNLGVEFCSVRLRTQPETDILAVFIRGLADEELVRVRVTEPLERMATQQPGLGRLTPGTLQGVLPLPWMLVVNDLSKAISEVLEGATALFFDGTAAAVLVRTEGAVTRPVGSLMQENPYKEIFGPGLMGNLALIRKGLRDPDLVGEPHELPRGRAAAAAVIYLKGRADPELVTRIRGWLQRRAGEEALHRGLAAGMPGKLGLLPDLMSTAWPDKVASLLDAGYVVALVDRMAHAYIAPVTAAAMLYGPGDESLRRPISAALRLLRIALAAAVLLAPAAVVALMNYHQEMIPTPFLLGLAATRENAPVPIVAEMLGLEILQELIREATFRLPIRMTPGHSLIGGAILLLLVVEAGLVGPLPALVSAVVACASLGLPSYDLIYMIRVGRFWMVAGAAMFGLYGMAAFAFLFSAYLCQSKSFGVPFIGEAGVHFTAPGRLSSRPERRTQRARGRTVR